MSVSDSENPDDVSFSAHDRIDQACDRFEAAWKAGERPRIEDYLAGATLAERGTLLRELLILELFWRKRVGERPHPREYVERFPEKEDIAEVVAAFARDASAPARFTNHEFKDEGGLGKVFTAHDDELNRIVAVKTIRDDCAGDPQSQARFVREAEITGRLEHPGIVAVYSLNRSDDGRPFYAMRLIRGETLKEAVARFHAADSRAGDPGEHSLALRGLLRRLIDVCNAVAYAHSRGVIHRDLKPENIMLGPFGETLVLDWGLAKPVGSSAEPGSAEPPIAPAASSGSSDTQPGSHVGTPRYMSPEQAAGQPEGIGPATDVYSLGATLYHVLTGRPPFCDDRDMAVILEKVQASAFAPPRSLRPDIPRPLDAICLKAMARRPEDRYASARAVAGDLEHWLADEPVAAWREPLQARARRWMRRHRTLVTSTAAVLIFSVIGLAGFAAVLAGKNRELDRQRQRAEEREGLAIDAVQNFRDAVTANPELKNRHELDALRKALLKEPLEFFRKLRDQLQSDRDTRPDALAKLASANFDLARTTAEIGSIPDATRSYAESIAIQERLVREHPAVARYRHTLGSSHHNLANLLSATRQRTGAQESYRRAVATFERLARDYPSAPQYQSGLATCHDDLAILLQVTGQTTQALELHQRALEIRERLARENPSVTEYQSDLARSHNNIGFLLSETGRQAEAIESHRRAVEMRERLVRENPLVVEFQNDLAKSCENVGILQNEAGRAAEALESYRQALAIREQLVRDRPSVVEFQRNLARTHNNIGAPLSTTGQSARALESYRRALEIQERLARENPAAREFPNDLARMATNIGNVFRTPSHPAEALESFRRALQILEGLASDDPTVTEHQHELATSHNNIGTLLSDTGQAAEALKSHRRALEIQERLVRDNPAVTKFQSHLANTHINIGVVLQITGRPAEALESYRRALAIHERLARDNSSVIEHRSNLAASLYNIGLLLRGSGRPTEALETYRRGLAIWERMVQENPTVTGYRRGLAMSHTNIGNLLRETGHPREARESYGRALAIRERLARDNRTVTEFQGDLAESHMNIGNLLSATGHASEALESHRRAAAIERRLVRDNPMLNKHQRDLALSHNNIGSVLSDTGRKPEALESYGRALSIVERLVRDNPSIPEYRTLVGTTLHNIAAIEMERGRWQAARERLERAIEHLREAMAAMPNHPYHQQVFRASLLNLANVYHELSEPADALRVTRELAALARGNPTDLYNVACALALNVPIAVGQEQQALAAEAMQTLKAAIAAGWHDARLTSRDPDLAPLRDRADFRQLLAGMFDRGFPADPFVRQDQAGRRSPETTEGEK